MHDLDSGQQHRGPPQLAPRPPPQVGVLEVHEIPRVEPPQSLPIRAPQQQTRTGQPVHRGRGSPAPRPPPVGLRPRIPRPNPPQQRMSDSVAKSRKSPPGRITLSVAAHQRRPVNRPAGVAPRPRDQRRNRPRGKLDVGIHRHHPFFGGCLLFPVEDGCGVCVKVRFRHCQFSLHPQVRRRTEAGVVGPRDIGHPVIPAQSRGCGLGLGRVIHTNHVQFQTVSRRAQRSKHGGQLGPRVKGHRNYADSVPRNRTAPRRHRVAL